MHEPAPRLTNLDDIEARLARLGPGLCIELLLTSVRAFQAGRENTSAFYPYLHGPFNGHAEATAALRAALSTHGWSLIDEGNYARALSPDSRTAIAVASADEYTGLDQATAPSTRCPKGTMTREAVDVNAQLDFFAGLGMPESVLPPTRTWLLLISSADAELRSELSLPTHFANGTPDEYKERLILPFIDLVGGTPGPTGKPEPGDDFDVEVTRKTG